MGHVNQVAVSGNLVAAPELKKVGDLAICDLRLAVNRSKKASDGSGYEEEVSYFDVTVFGNFAELVARKLQKADPIVVTGELKQERWENDQGENRSKVKIVGRQIDGAGMYRKKDEETEPAAPGAADVRNELKVDPPADDDIPF